MIQQFNFVMPIVAIVLPVYNTSRYLTECLDSILSQTYRDFVVYAVNDGSTDDSLEILTTYQSKDARIKVINQKNQGVAGARNAALQAIYSSQQQIDYVLFIDSDDRIDCHCLESCVREISDVDMLIFSFQRFNKNGIVSSKRIVPEYEYLDHEATCEHYFRLGKWEKGNISCFYGLFNKCFKIHTLNQTLFDTSLKIAEDQDFLIRVLPHIQKSKVIPDALYFYRLRSSSLTHSKICKGFTDDFHVYRKYIEKTEYSGAMKIGIQHRFVQILWNDLHRVLTSSETFFKKYLFYKQVKIQSLRSLNSPFVGKDKKRLRLMRAGFLINFLSANLKNFKKRQGYLDN